MSAKTSWKYALLGLLVIALAFAMTVAAQVQTKTTTEAGAPNVQTSVERGEVVTVSGNDLVVKMEDGSIRHFANVPESARVTVDGKELGIHDLKPGMKLERTITTTSTPKTITTVQSVTGRIAHITPPLSVVLTLDDGTNEQFKIPRGQQFNVDGKMVDAFGLRNGMRITATKVVETPTTEVEKQAKVTGTAPPTPEPPPAGVPIVIAVVKAPAAPAAAPTETASNKLPNSGSPLPLIALLGVLLVASPFALKAFRFVRHSG